MRVIKDNRIVSDDWQLVEPVSNEKALPEGDIIVPFSYWLEHRNELIRRDGKLGVCIGGDDETGDLVADLEHFDLIAVEFPSFRDGRGYSHSRILRDHHHYKGDIRAVGNVLRDQLFFMQRCGISSFYPGEDSDLEDAMKGLSAFSVKYQTAADGAQPVYKQRH